MKAKTPTINKDQILNLYIEPKQMSIGELEQGLIESHLIITHLRKMIKAESKKWAAHHTDAKKKAYWQAFGRRGNKSEFTNKQKEILYRSMG